MNTFQTVLLAIFGVIAVVGTIMFSGYFSKNTNSEESILNIWGTLPGVEMRDFFDTFNKKKLVNQIRYEEHSESTFDYDLVEALANGAGPDLIIITDDRVLRHEKKIFAIPYENVAERTFRDTFVDEATIFLSTEGILGVPILVDPLVLFWNKDLFSNAEIASAPSSWEQVLGITSKLTVKDSRGNISKSAIALGSFNNIEHAKQILATLLIQADQLIVGRGVDGIVKILLESSRTGIQTGGEAALRFYTEFSNPSTDEAYTWNSSIRSARTAFSADNLAMYIAPFSEKDSILRENPHLNFDIALLPQRENGKVRATYGKIYAIAALRSSRMKSSAVNASLILGQSEYAKIFSDSLRLAPARRDLLSQRIPDPDLSIAYKSAVISKSWLDPNPLSTAQIFKNVIDSITSGTAKEGEGIIRLSSEIEDLLKR
ncbi:MAG: extracellular solute-binding protein [Candidatus Vogelbacteria bacterium]|nr:extracellular solute-binding protein [Candidatus Vogelbacteria bacterium]